MDAGTLVPLLTEGRPGFVRLARRRLPTEADAEDVVQRAMIRAAARAGSLEDPARLGAWFGRILQRAVADFYRTRTPETPTEMGGIEAEDDAAPQGNPCRCSLRLLAALRPAYAEVVRRVDVEGESPEAVAKALAISEANLYVRLHRARRALREQVKAHCGVSTCGPCLDCTCHANERCGGEPTVGVSARSR